jgi:AcrR family transcriptional regulator
MRVLRPFALLGVTTLLVLALGFLGCRGTSPAGSSQEMMERLVDSLRLPVERATGLTFKSSPRSAIRTRRQVRAYLISKLDEELPPPKLQGMEAAYRLLGLLPDTLQLRSLLLDLYTEQVAGYYDPDSAMLFGVSGADPGQLRLVLAHEMVHALQGQYLRLDSIMGEKSNSDRLTAAQSILEGQATLASIEVLAPGQDVKGNPEFWDIYREQVRQQQSSMPVFAGAPLVVREALIFPYLAGAEFMHWWESSPLRDTVPYGPRMPVSTEQILFPDRYARGDAPMNLAFPPDSAVLYEDVLGESEIRVLIARLRGNREVRSSGPLGWAGDRYRVYPSPEGPALVWYVVWDDTRSAERFTWGYGGKLRATSRPGYRTVLESFELEGKPATLYVLAPSAWQGWEEIPKAFVRP